MTDWVLGKKVISAVSTYVALLASASRPVIRDLQQHAVIEAQKEILSETKRLMNDLHAGALPFETAREKLDFTAQWQRNRIRSFRRFTSEGKLAALDSEITAVAAREQKRLEALRKNALPLPPLTRRERLAQNMVVHRKEIGMPFCLARIPYKERLSRPANFEQIFNWLDGKRNFLEALRIFYLETGRKLTEKEISYWFRYLELLARYGYVSIAYKKVLTKKDIQNGLRRLGVKSGDKIILHSSCSSLGHVKNGPKTVCKALMELITPRGVVMMTSFNHYGIVGPNGQGYYDPKTTPTKNGIVPETFRKMKNVHRSLDPSHPFVVWGKDALNYVKQHHKVPTMGEGSPLHFLEKADGKVILIDCPTANTFHHVVETTNHVHCLGQRTEEYPVKLPSGKMVKCRTWGWREKVCPFIDGKQIYISRMRELGLLREKYIGQAPTIVFKMSDCRRVIEDLLKGRIRGFSGCQACQIRPRKVPATCKSDWDVKKQRLLSDTTAFVGAMI